MKYNLVEIRKTIHSSSGWMVRIVKDNEERQETETSPQGWFYYYPETMSDAEAIWTLWKHNVESIDEEIKRLKELRETYDQVFQQKINGVV